jgi:hypothetical protein
MRTAFLDYIPDPSNDALCAGVLNAFKDSKLERVSRTPHVLNTGRNGLLQVEGSLILLFIPLLTLTVRAMLLLVTEAFLEILNLSSYLQNIQELLNFAK